VKVMIIIKGKNGKKKKPLSTCLLFMIFFSSCMQLKTNYEVSPNSEFNCKFMEKDFTTVPQNIIDYKKELESYFSSKNNRDILLLMIMSGSKEKSFLKRCYEDNKGQWFCMKDNVVIEIEGHEFIERLNNYEKGSFVQLCNSSSRIYLFYVKEDGIVKFKYMSDRYSLEPDELNKIQNSIRIMEMLNETG